MEWTMLNFVLTLSTILLSFLCFVYFHLTKNYKYWAKRGVPYKKPHFPFGSTKDLILAHTYIGKGYDNMYKDFSDERFFGIIDVQNPVLILRDPNLIKLVLIKDFEHFSVRTYLGAKPKEYILRHVINMNGQEWREMRTLLTPAFTSVKMKSNFSLLEKCSERLIEQLCFVSKENPIVEVTDILARFTMDVIASIAFGLETNSVCYPKCKLFTILGPLLRTSKSRFFRRFLTTFFPNLTKFLPVQLIPSGVTEMLTRTVHDAVNHRQKTFMKRNDFLDVLIEKKGLTIEEITAQAFVFFIAGYTTDTSVLTFCLYELSKHPIIQEKLYNDIQKAVDKHNGKITFEALQEMRFMDQVVSETLRMYGSGQTLIRTCTKPYKIPDSDLVLEKGIRVIIPTYSLHHDENYYPEPYEFRPERFSPEESKIRHPFVFLPFGEGPRNCIGRSFGIQQIKIGLACVVFNFQVCLDSTQNVPIEIDRRNIVITPANPVFLRFTHRNNMS